VHSELILKAGMLNARTSGGNGSFPESLFYDF
jgi:hypothetical protein